ncbi:MAG: alpha/beta fold hydrolase, partial [Burkholderiales bacterium]
MRGTGLSDREGVECSNERYLEDFAAVVEAAGLRRFDLAGMTGGGALAVVHAARHPQQVSRLVLYGTYSRGRIVRSTTPGQREKMEVLLKLMEIGWDKDDPSFRQFYAFQYFPDGTAAQFASFNELMRRSVSGSNAVSLLRAWFLGDVRRDAPRVRCPALVLHAR